MKEDVDVDVVILGGAVAGCWIAKTLRAAGYTVAIVTLGGVSGGQTAHSHVYIHRGHLYRKEALNELKAEGSTLVSDLQWASQLWDEWFRELPDHGGGLDAAPTQGLFGFTSEAEAAAVDMGAWFPFGLHSERADVLPAIFDGSVLQAFRHVNARCLDAGRLVSELLSSAQVAAIDGDDVRLHVEDGLVVAVDATGGPTGSAVVRGRAAVFAAGAGNRQLLAALSGATPEVRDRPSFMLVVDDPSRAVLAPLSGVFNLSSDDSLFLVSREDSRSTTWLLSDAGHQPAASDWIQYVGAELEAVFPSIWLHREQLRWGYYAAPKAEVVLDEAFHRQVHSHVVMEVAKNVIACWPTKLTLAPLAARDVLDIVDDLLGSPRLGGHMGAAPASAPRVLGERWRSVGLLPWQTFSEGALA